MFDTSVKPGNINLNVNGVGMTSLRTRKRLVESFKQRGIQNELVLNAMIDVPRHLFVDEAISSHAYNDTPLPIGFGQTISQPYIVARMTEALFANTHSKPSEDFKLDSVLEIGTGSGYQAAILSKLFKQVYTIERIGALLESAKRRFQQLNLRNIKAVYNDGHCGWAQYAPFDAIIVTCAAAAVPPMLLEQLKDGGRLVIPVKFADNTNREDTQQLEIITKTNNDYNITYLELVKFVPLLSGKQ